MWRIDTLALGFVDAINQLFSNDRSAVAQLRRSGLRAVQASSLAKHWFMMRALGLAGAVPDMVKAS